MELFRKVYGKDRNYYARVATKELKEQYDKYNERCVRCQNNYTTSAEACYYCDRGDDRFEEYEVISDVEGLDWIMDQLDKMSLNVVKINPIGKTVVLDEESFKRLRFWLMGADDVIANNGIVYWKEGAYKE